MRPRRPACIYDLRSIEARAQHRRAVPTHLGANHAARALVFGTLQSAERNQLATDNRSLREAPACRLHRRLARIDRAARKLEHVRLDPQCETDGRAESSVIGDRGDRPVPGRADVSKPALAAGLDPFLDEGDVRTLERHVTVTLWVETHRVKPEG